MDTATTLQALWISVFVGVQVEGGDGALAVYVMPRFVLHNTLQVALLYKQQGTHAERSLMPAAATTLQWSDAGCPLRLCVRVQEAGWLWSGGVAIHTPGDMFIKIRHRCNQQFICQGYHMC